MGLRSLAGFPVYPFLVAALPIIYFYEANFRMLGAGDGLRLTILYWAVTGILLSLGRLFWKDVHRAAMVVAPLAVVLFLGAKVGVVLTVISLAVVLGLGILLRRRPAEVSRGSLVLNAVLLVLAGMPVVQMVTASRGMDSPVPTALFASDLPLSRPAAADPPPDIYFLLMDALGQPDYLEREYGMSPRVVEDVLAARGFRVLRHSMSNYPQTALSVAATMNAAYVHDLLEIPDHDNADRRVLADLVARNRVVRDLRNNGYDLVTYPSGYPLTRMEGAVRRHHPPVDPSFLEFYVLEDGFLPLANRLAGRGPSDFSFALQRNRVEYVFDHLSRARDGVPANRPVFVFAHVMTPHPPFVFSRTGEGLRSRGSFAFADGSHWYNIHGREGTPYYIMYSEQLTYIMRRLGEAVDAILAASPRPPVIIVQGDHGPGSKLNHERVLYTDHEERLGIFNAWYLPPGIDLELEEGSTSVNTFPALLNTILGGDLSRNPDRYFFARMSAPYAHHELTPEAD